MEKIIEIYSKYKEYIMFGILLIIFLGVQAFIFWYFSNDVNSIKESLKTNTVEEKKYEKESTKLVVDIKGEVKRPGVYFLDKDKRVIDVVKKAGGFTVNADASANNLSMKLKDEMVIVIYSKKEIRNYLKTKEEEKLISEKCESNIITNDSCIKSENKENQDNQESTNSSEKEATSSSSEKTKDTSKSNTSENNNKLISINTATLEELMTLSGIGESKAKAIIEYRKTKKFESIEELKEVSGIGDALFEKIKDFITT